MAGPSDDDGMCTWFERWLMQSSVLGSDITGRKLTIRNLTSQQLRITYVTRYGSVRDWNRSEVLPMPTPDIQDVLLPQFSTTRTDIRAYDRSDNEILELTLHSDGGQDSLKLFAGSAHHRGRSQHKDHNLIAILDTVDAFLTICEQPDLKSWMRDFRDDTSLAALSIPGTHNSPTCHRALPSVRCQAVSPIEQLEHGVRFFDIRVQPHKPQDATNETLFLVHGAFSVALTGGKTLRQLISDIEDFLTANPSETVIMSLKREGLGKATDAHLSDILKAHYSDNWFTESRIPTIGEVRGKIVLMRRFGLSDNLRASQHGFGLDAENWSDNTTSCVHGQVCVQDFYGVMQPNLIAKKIDVCCDHFERAATVVCPVPGLQEADGKKEAEQLIYLNFLSASNLFNLGCWPERIAAKLNPAVTKFLCEKHDCGDKGVDAPGEKFDGDGGLGIVVCDWVGKDGDWRLIDCIIAMNSRRLFRERGYGWSGIPKASS